MSLSTNMSMIVEGYKGDVLRLSHFLSTSETHTQYLTPLEFTLAALTTQNIEFPTGLPAQQFTCKILFIETTLPIDVTFTTPIGPAIPEVPTAATMRVTNFIMLNSSITDLYIYNPNNVAVGLKITAIGD